MPTASFSVEIWIKASVEEVFAYVSDLTRHTEWADNPLEITPVTGGAPGLGSRYRSAAQSHGVNFYTELVVTVFEPPRLFGFGGADSTGEFSHEFSFSASKDGTLVKRRITFQTTFSQWLMYLVVLYPVRRPSAMRTLRRLKKRLEKTG
jgi:uncharacterized protein YndB with AHSA1/START domain